MYTSIFLVALSGSVVASTPVDNLTWEPNYDQARQVGQAEKKPLAVIVGSGEAGYERLCRDGKLGSDAQKALGENYICVYLDTDTQVGKKLASDFGITRGTGLVLSNRSGNLQAFNHDGDLSNADLNRWLTRFADPNVVVSTTLTNDAGRTSMYPPSDSAPGAWTGYGPAGYAPGMYAPYMGYGGAPMFGGGCPGGNCGGGGRRR
jgi:hypothetical protein